MISSKNIFYHELIGLELKIVDSSNDSLIGICGTVLDETKKTFLIGVDIDAEGKSDSDAEKSHKESSDLSSFSEKLIPKDVCVFQFKVPDGTIVEIDGKILNNRPEDRIKKRYKKI